MSSWDEVNLINSIINEVKKQNLPMHSSYLMFKADVPQSNGYGRLNSDMELSHEDLQLQYDFKGFAKPRNPMREIRLVNPRYELWFGDDDKEFYHVVLDLDEKRAVFNYAARDQNDETAKDVVGILERYNFECFGRLG
jgi:hypothetical protein